MTRTLLLVAGPSGSGKSRLTRLAAADGRAVALSLDDFYFDADHPGLPTTPLGIPDWDDPACWDLPLAVATLRALLDDGEAELPVYDISLSRRVGTRRLGDSRSGRDRARDRPAGSASTRMTPRTYD